MRDFGVQRDVQSLSYAAVHQPVMARTWSDEEVMEGWHRLFKGSMQNQQYMAGEVLELPGEQL